MLYIWVECPKIVFIPEDPFEAGLEVTDGLANLLVGGLIPLGFAGAEVLISHLHPPVKNNKSIEHTNYKKNGNKDIAHNFQVRYHLDWHDNTYKDTQEFRR